MIKDRLKELLWLCIDNGLQFEYCATVESVSIYKYTEKKDLVYVIQLYSLRDWNGTEEQHIAKLNEFIEQIKGMN